MIWATTEYTLTPEGAWAERHRDLTPAELPAAIYAVEASDDHGRTYASNGLRWASVEDAKRWASGLAMRWFGCTNIRVVSITPPPEADAPYPGYDVVDVVYQTL